MEGGIGEEIDIRFEEDTLKNIKQFFSGVKVTGKI